MELSKQDNWQTQKTYMNSQMKKTYVVIKRLGRHRSIKYVSFLCLFLAAGLTNPDIQDYTYIPVRHYYVPLSKNQVLHKTWKYHDSSSFLARRRLWHAFVKLTRTDFIYETDVAKDEIGQMNMQFITWIFVLDTDVNFPRYRMNYYHASALDGPICVSV